MCIYMYVVQARSVSTAVQTDQQFKHEHDGTQAIHSAQNLCTYAATIECKSGICTTNLLKSSMSLFTCFIYVFMCTCVSVKITS